MLLQFCKANAETVWYELVDDPPHDGPGWYYGDAVPWLIAANAASALCAAHAGSGVLMASGLPRDAVKERLATYRNLEFYFNEDGASLYGGDLCIFTDSLTLLIPWTRSGLEAAAFTTSDGQIQLVEGMFSDISRYYASEIAFDSSAFLKRAEERTIARVNADYDGLEVTLTPRANFDCSLAALQRTAEAWNQGLIATGAQK